MDVRPVVSGCARDHDGVSGEVLAALVMSLRGDLAERWMSWPGRGSGSLSWRSRPAKMSRNSSKPPSSDGLGKPPPKPPSRCGSRAAASRAGRTAMRAGPWAGSETAS